MTSDPIQAAIEQLRASVEALPEGFRPPWKTSDRDGEYVVLDVPADAPGRHYVVAHAARAAPHIALTASPHVTEALAALLEAELAERSEDARLATIPPGLDLAEIERDYATPAAEAEIRRRRALVALAEAITHRSGT